MRLPIATKSAQGRAVPLTAESLVNMYAEVAPGGSKSPVMAISCPGVSVFSSIHTGKLMRGLYFSNSNNSLWAVIGLKLYKVSADGSTLVVGTVGGYGRVSMADNGTQLVVATEAITYVVVMATNTLIPITDNDFPNADTVAYLGGYFAFNNNPVILFSS